MKTEVVLILSLEGNQFADCKQTAGLDKESFQRTGKVRFVRYDVNQVRVESAMPSSARVERRIWWLKNGMRLLVVGVKNISHHEEGRHSGVSSPEA